MDAWRPQAQFGWFPDQDVVAILTSPNMVPADFAQEGPQEAPPSGTVLLYDLREVRLNAIDEDHHPWPRTPHGGIKKKIFTVWVNNIQYRNHVAKLQQNPLFKRRKSFLGPLFAGEGHFKSRLLVRYLDEGVQPPVREGQQLVEPQPAAQEQQTAQAVNANQDIITITFDEHVDVQESEFPTDLIL